MTLTKANDLSNTKTDVWSNSIYKMLIANPNVYMKEHFIQLLKYIDLYLVSQSAHCELSIQKKFGIKNNTVKVLKIVEKKVYKLNRKYL